MTLLAIAVGCPGQPGVLQWFMGVGGLVHVLVAGGLLVVAWERLQDRLRAEDGV